MSPENFVSILISIKDDANLDSVEKLDQNTSNESVLVIISEQSTKELYVEICVATLCYPTIENEVPKLVKLFSNL